MYLYMYITLSQECKLITFYIYIYIYIYKLLFEYLLEIIVDSYGVVRNIMHLYTLSNSSQWQHIAKPTT